MTDKISIVVTLYNYGEFVLDALDSIIQQTYTNRELIIIDDLSTDDGPQKVETFISNHPNQDIRFFKNEENMGVSKSTERGILETKGKYIALCDADDVRLPEKLDKQYIFMIQGGYDLSCNDLILVDQNLNTLKKNFIFSQKKTYKKYDSFKKILDTTPMITSGMMFSVGMVKYIAPFTYIDYQDVRIQLIVGMFGKIGFLNENLTLYRKHSNNISGIGKNRGIDILDDYSVRLKKQKNFLSIYQSLSKLSFVKKEDKKLIISKINGINQTLKIGLFFSKCINALYIYLPQRILYLKNSISFRTRR